MKTLTSTLFYFISAAAAASIPAPIPLPAINIPLASSSNKEARDLSITLDVALQPFSITFYEPFNGKTGSFSSQNWIIDTGTSYNGGPSQWGNFESEIYTASSSSLSLSGYGTLLITPQNVNGKWYSGRIQSTRGDFQCNPGKKMYIESRLAVGNAPASSTQGIWPAFWSLGTAYRGNYQNWPKIGEWDFMETMNGLEKIWNTVHCGTQPGGPCNEWDGITNGGNTKFTRGKFHVVSFMVDRTTGSWLTDSLTWYLDGQVTFTVTGAKLGNQQAWNELVGSTHFLLYNVAVGGTFPNAVAGATTPNSKTVGGANTGMEIDYVIVYNT